MKVAIIGLWHLGLVTAACLTKANHNVIAFDTDDNLIANLQKNTPPIFEPGLTELLIQGKQNNLLTYTSDPSQISAAEIVWLNYDTPVDTNDNADVDFVINEIKKIAPHVKSNALFLISSQMPVGSTNKIRQLFSIEKNITLGYIPENLRLGKAIQVFTQPDRFVVGLQNQKDQEKICQLLGAFTNNFVWMSIPSAEMTKHALNAFLALSVTFINEIASICEKVGANSSEVEKGLKSEERIGPKAYLRAGGAIAGGTLLRDINYLKEISAQSHLKTPLIEAVLTSNAYHKNWVQRKIKYLFDNLKEKTITVLGLTYKPNTNTLRRSSSVETCEWLFHEGAQVQAFDPAILTLPPEYAAYILLKTNIQEAIKNSDAIVIATEWPDFKNMIADEIVQLTKKPIILDANGFLMQTLGTDCRIQYCSVGRVI